MKAGLVSQVSFFCFFYFLRLKMANSKRIGFPARCMSDYRAIVNINLKYNGYKYGWAAREARRIVRDDIFNYRRAQAQRMVAYVEG